MAQPRYKTEVFVPIKQDSQSFEQRQKNIWDDMHVRMEQRRREWESEVERMRRDFFRLKPTEARRGSSENLLDKMDLNDIFYDDAKEGTKRFRVSFDVSQFLPEEISVRTEEQKLLVQAHHEEKGTGRNVSREFSRQIDIPKHVDPQKLQCTLSNDGILQIEAPVPAPAYDRIKDSTGQGQGYSYSPPPPQGSPHGPAVRPALSTSPSLQSGPIVTEEDGSRKFKITVEIGSDYDPEDIVVKTVDRKLKVSARHEVKLPGRSSCKEFSREFDLPENVDPNLVTAAMSDDGVLLVEAPVASYSHGSYTGRPGSKKQPMVTISFGH